jgi:hypothetical protein
MLSRQEISQQINGAAESWGKCGYPNWSKRKNVTQRDVVDAGILHACPVIPMVIGRNRPPESDWMAYQLKSYSFSAVGDMFANVGRPDLQRDWVADERKKRNERTHPSLRKQVLYPKGHDSRVLPAPTRTAQVLYADLFRTMALTADGERLDLAPTAEDQAKFELPLKGISEIARSASSIQDFTSSMACHTARVLLQNGVSKEAVLNLLVNSFAKPGLIKETGQQKPAENMVADISRKMSTTQSLADFAVEFNQRSVPLVTNL